ncbi:cytochrome P450 [Guyanagaster necrorhizus]|uniref:Cytochrome P450 n=1 Tax=Guyanagaster necrorhizus TaxID=856835 RepID=A0A9P7VQB3_9AGAR|nr:cytochrome P450 [Guyanagaster necrorhizus MCA 3950]KAG7444713.1 cytochrome P450 [Guyanagaster necrorhizus MCA 3950]
MHPTSLFIVSLLAIITAICTSKRKRSGVKQLRGPTVDSWLLGHDYAVQYQDQVGDLEYAWFREYGAAFRGAAPYGQSVLFLGDAKGLQHVLHGSGYRYPKTPDSDYNTNILFGKGIATVAGSVHQRHRKVMNPAFSAAQLRTFLSLFQRSAKKFSGKLIAIVDGGESSINIAPWLGKLTLDIIGTSAFGYEYGALDDENNKLANTLNNLFHDSELLLSRAAILFATLPRVLPKSLIQILDLIPSRRKKHFSNFKVAAQNAGREVLKENVEGNDLDSSTGKDVLSILARANAQEEEKKRLSDDEVLAQIATLTLAGHETTASTLTWTLFELCNHPAQQDRIRAEIAQVRSRYQTKGELTSADYDSMPFMNAVIKETLRFHPIVPSLLRSAACDDVIPLTDPVITSAGVKLTEISVEKGQLVDISIGYYNRNPTVWGSDADVWNPDRFLGELDKQTPLGVFANLLTFSAGVRSCIGWRFAVMELQVILFELLESFKFSFPKAGIDIKRKPAGIMIPVVGDEMSKGTQMPLRLIPSPIQY